MLVSIRPAWGLQLRATLQEHNKRRAFIQMRALVPVAIAGSSYYSPFIAQPVPVGVLSALSFYSHLPVSVSLSFCISPVISCPVANAGV